MYILIPHTSFSVSYHKFVHCVSYSVDVSVKRVGGAYGAKITRAHWIAAGCALAANATRRFDPNHSSWSTYHQCMLLTSRPVRMHLDIDTNMKMIGKRIPYYATFTVSGEYVHEYVFYKREITCVYIYSTLQIGCTDDGILNGIDVTIYNNCGWCNNDNAMGMAIDHIDNGRQIHHYMTY